jgi:(R,R)-butanediol dehydrogenase / meso-butanediol dehydrogenase / diacetyl reductase
VNDPSSQDVKEEVLELTDGIDADIGFECAGVNEELDLLLDAVRRPASSSTCRFGASQPQSTCRN